MNIVKKYSLALSILFSFLFSAGVAECIIPQPFRIGGTVTVDGSQLTQASDSGYSFVVTEQDGNDFDPEALDTDGLNASNWYIIDIPIYDPNDQQGGANPGDTAVIHVYRSGEELIVTSPANGSLIVGTSGSTQQIDLTVESPYTPPPQYQLTASVSGGNGSVSPTSGTYNEGTLVTLTATPNTGYRVASWSGTDNDSSDSNTNSVTMNSNRTVTVSFEEIPSTQYTLTAYVSGGNGSVSPTSGTYNEGTLVTLTATPNTGYRVASWSGTDNDSSDSNTNSVTMNSNRTVTVSFEEIPSTQYTLTAYVSGGNGSVSPTSGTYSEGTLVTLTATPNTGYRVASWSGTNNDSSDSNTNSVTMNSNRTVTVSFEEIPSAQFTLTAYVSGGNGSVSPTSGTYNEGTLVTLTATPNTGYRVASWSGTNNDSSDSNTNSVTMNSNRTVTVSFEEIPSTQFTLTAYVSGGNGSVSPTSGTYNEGTLVTLTATPNTGYRVASWSGTNNDSSDSNTNSVTMDADKNVVVTFIESAPVIERFTSAPSAINRGESSALSWNIVGANSANIDNGIGSLDTSEGSINVSPDETTIYTLTASNSGGTVMASVSVTVEESSTEEEDHDNDGIPDSEDPDDDNDGLSDVWEEAYGLDPLDSSGINGRDGDLDGDGWSNHEEYENETDPSNSASVPSSSKILIAETIPKNLSGLNDDHRVPNDTSFSLRIEAFNGIDITKTTSIRFTVDDGGMFNYTRDLSDTQVVRVVKLTEEADTDVGHLWVTYYKSSEPSLYPYNTYPFDISITIKVDIVDREGFQMEQAVFNIGTETEAEHEVAQEPTDLFDVSTVDPEDPGLEGEHDTGIQVDSGDFAGARIIYNSDEPLEPTFDFSAELPALDIEGMIGVGIPLVLQPHAVFSTPVRIFIPCPGYSDVSELSIMFYNGEEWVAACDQNGEILPGGEGWMVPSSRVNHNNGDPSTIEIQVYHFSAVQAAADAEDIEDEVEDVEGIVDSMEEAATDDSGAGCFIRTAAPSLNMELGTSALFLICALAAVIHTAVVRRRKNAYLRQLR